MMSQVPLSMIPAVKYEISEFPITHKQLYEMNVLGTYRPQKEVSIECVVPVGSRRIVIPGTEYDAYRLVRKSLLSQLKDIESKMPDDLYELCREEDMPDRYPRLNNYVHMAENVLSVKNRVGVYHPDEVRYLAQLVLHLLKRNP